MLEDLQKQKLQAEIDKLKAEENKIKEEVVKSNQLFSISSLSNITSLVANLIIVVFALYTGGNLLELQNEVIKIRQEKLKDLQSDIQVAEKTTEELSNLIESKREETRKTANIPIGSTVFIQFRGSLERTLMNKLAQFYQEKGYNAPGVERVAGNYQNEVRYFHPSDKKIAENIAKITNEFFRNNNCPLKQQINLRQMNLSQFPNVPEKQVELWIHHTC